jgi:hypothetical protein
LSKIHLDRSISGTAIFAQRKSNVLKRSLNEIRPDRSGS